MSPALVAMIAAALEAELAVYHRRHGLDALARRAAGWGLMLLAVAFVCAVVDRPGG